MHDDLFSPVLPLSSDPLLARMEEQREELNGAIADVMLLLPGWTAETWRRQASLADALRYLADEMRVVSDAGRIDEMRHMHAAGLG